MSVDPNKKWLSILTACPLFVAVASVSAHADAATPPSPPPSPSPSPYPATPLPSEAATPPREAANVGVLAAEAPPEMSPGRRLVSIYNTRFQWALVPGVIFANDRAVFSFGIRLGYGFDLGPVILVPGIWLAGYFINPDVYLGLATLRIVVPVDGFAPFIEGGFGVEQATDPPRTGYGAMGGVGVMYHVSPRFAAGIEGTYQFVSSTGFSSFGFAPILAFAF